MSANNSREEQLSGQLAETRAELESFTYSVSHDLKSPLHTILGFVDLVLEDLAAGRQQTIVEDLQRVKEASLCLQSQLEAVLEFSRMGRAPHEPELIPVERIWGTLRTRWDPAFGRVGGRLELVGSASAVYADPVKFAAMLEHFLDNALSFRSAERALCVQVRLDEEGGFLHGQVRDNGLGVEPAQLERIFELFRKVDAGSPGRGVGLTLARKLVGLHGGRVRALSEGLDCGMTIDFMLPMAGGKAGD